MRDPQSVDPGSVSAFAVYKGLVPGLKSYQDTSEGSAVSKRQKARRRNRKSKGAGNDALKNESSEEKRESSNGKVQEANKKEGKSSKSTPQKNGSIPVKAPVTPLPVASTSVAPNSEQKKKKKRKKNKKRNKSMNGSDDDTLPVDASNVSDDDEEFEDFGAFPLKAKRAKESEIVPNPLAMNFMNGNSSSSKKSKGAPRSTDATPKPQPGKSLKKKLQKSFVIDPSLKVESKAPPPDAKDTFPLKRIEDSVEHGKEVLEWLIHPVTHDIFMKNYWEKKPLLIKRTHRDSTDFYKFILTTQKLDGIFRQNDLKYGVNLDITSYTDGVRETLSENMQGRVRPAVVWDYYNNGCSLRMLNPQSYIQKLWRINAALQECLGSFVGANMYLTPPESQGFAPHFDDIEAFILQVEGKKQWKVYAPRDDSEKLPRFSSKNFTEESLEEPIIDVVLEEGDLLYFPRGYIHQAKTVDGEHSLHLTISCQQLNTYGDLLKHHVNHALEKLLSSDVQLRQGLPVDYLSYMGIAHENSKDKTILKKREAFSKKIETLVGKIAKESCDFAADAMGKKFIWDSLPPFLTHKERETSVLEDGEWMLNGKVFNRVEFGPEVEVKLIRKNCVRLVVEEGLLKLYYSTENPLVYHEGDPQNLELSVEVAPAVNHLISQYPAFTKIEDLPLSSNDIGEKIQIISDLWERGLIFTKKPLEMCDVDEDFTSEEDDDQEDGDKQIAANAKEDDVESINLSDLPNEDDESDDEFYDTSMMGLEEESDETDSDDEDFDFGSIDEEADDGQADEENYFANQFDFGGEEEEDSENDSGEESEDYEDEEGEEEEEIDDDEFDKMDMMEDSEEDEDN